MVIAVDVGSSFTKVARFDTQGSILQSTFFPSTIQGWNPLLKWLQPFPSDRIVYASVHPEFEKFCHHENSSLLSQWLPLSAKDAGRLVLDVEEKWAVGADRIANGFGALSLFPTFDAIVADMGTAITVDLFLKEGVYKGGMILPGMEIYWESFSLKFPHFSTSIAPEWTPSLGITTSGQLHSGLYYGILGAVERSIAELRQVLPSPSSAKVFLTGGLTHLSPSAFPWQREWMAEFTEFIDVMEPFLTLRGIYNYFIEKQKETQNG